MEIIKIKDLNKYYGGKKVLSNISLNVKQGEIFGILGHNGAGKTTLINCIMQLISYEGDIKYSFDSKNIYSEILYQMQHSYYEKELKLLEICNLYKKLLNSNIDVKELLEEFGFKNDFYKYIKDFSGGQIQMISVLLTLIGNPKVIIFDELTTGIDSVNKRFIWDKLKKINKKKNITIILTSHYLEEVEYLADRIIVLKEGKIEKEGRIDEFINDQFNDMKKMEFKIDNIKLVEKLFKDNFYVRNKKVCIIYNKSVEEDMFKKVHEINGYNISIKNFSLEDAFLKLLGYTLEEEGNIRNE